MKPSAPKVSVIIATYNYSSVLRYAIASVLGQTWRDFELIVVGDGCTDDSEEVVRSFDDPRIRWLNLAENSGSKSVPQNAGVKLARSELIAYLAHDDLWHPTHLATVLAALTSSGADFAHTVAVYVPPPGETERHVSGIFPDGEFRSGHALVHSSVIHRKAIFERIGPWPDPRETQIPGDQLFWKRAADAGLRFCRVPKLTVWKFNASSRPNCYREQKADEQARYFRLLQEDTELVERELLEVAQSAMRHGLRPLEIYKVGRDAPPGSHLHLLRQIRGLEPAEEMLPLPLGAEENPFCVELAQKLSGEAGPLERLEMEVRVENQSSFRIGSEPPHPVHLSFHWLHADGSMAVLDGDRSQLIPPLEPHAVLHYFMVVHAPPEPGVYRFQPALVQEGVRWFVPQPGAELSEIRVLPSA